MINRIKITAWLLALLMPMLCIAGSRNKTFIRPPYLKEGDTVGIVAPASKLASDTDTAKMRQHFEAMGLKVKFGRWFLSQEEPHFAGTDEQRAADLQAMIDDKDVKAVVAYKGGYGSVRLLDRIDLQKLRRNPKWIVGYSDITMMHLALQEERIESLHATMPVNFLYDTIDLSAEAMRQALFGELRQIVLPPHPYNRKGEASGKLAGGNLTVLCSAIGTPEELEADEDTVLLIEDIGEAAYRIDRMMQQLLHSGKLKQVKAILVGYFTDIAKADSFTPDGGIYGLIRSYTDPLGIPVVFGFPAGHEQPNLALYMGSEVDIRVDDMGAKITFNQL